jgi:DNA polymerase V
MKKGSIDEGLVYHAGFPNAGEDQHTRQLSLDKLIVKQRANTYYWRLESARTELHWPAGTIVVVDRALTPADGRLVVAVDDDDFVLCYCKKIGFIGLDGAQLSEGAVLWGVVTHAIHEVR